MMKADVLSDVTSVKICESYTQGDSITTEFPYSVGDALAPNFRGYPSWELDGIPEYGNLPPNMQAFIKDIESSVKVPITLVSLGPDRKETVLKP